MKRSPRRAGTSAPGRWHRTMCLCELGWEDCCAHENKSGRGQHCHCFHNPKPACEKHHVLLMCQFNAKIWCEMPEGEEGNQESGRRDVRTNKAPFLHKNVGIKPSISYVNNNKGLLWGWLCMWPYPEGKYYPPTLILSMFSLMCQGFCLKST